MQDNDNYLLGIMAILLALTSFLLGGGQLILTPPITCQQVLGAICLLGAFCIGAYLLVRGVLRTRGRRNGKEIEDGFNITVDSRDFISMDNKRIKAFFDGGEKRGAQANRKV